MALIVKDRVQQTSTTTGTGTLTLSGTVSGFQTFSSAIGNTNTTYYAIVNDAEWEVGIGTVSAGALSRDTVLESSNGGSLVNFTAGTKYVFCTYPAEKSVYKDETDKVTGYVIENSSIGATTPSTGRFTDLTDTGLTSGRVTYASTGGNLVDSANLTFNGTTLTTTAVVTPSVTATTTDLTLSAISTGAVKFNTLGGLQAQVSNTASAVNYLQLSGCDSGGFSNTIGAEGSSTNIQMLYYTKGSNGHVFRTNGSGGQTQFLAAHTASAVNFVQVTGSATTKTPIYSVAGSDGNISMAFQPKGTGAINLAAGSSGVNISNGGTVTAVTGTNIGSSYTSFPSVVISAPTTAGGVQATASVAGMISNNPVTIASGGTGYTVGDTLTVVGGTSISGAATLTVNSVSGGVITAVFNLNFAGYTVLPTNPVSVTGGTGSGATFNLTYSLRSVSGFTITNAGSGYIEQPTVTFSGGGGSGAAAYATVGSGTKVTSLGNTLDLATPAGVGFRVTDVGNTTARYVQVFGATSTGTPSLSSNAGNLIISSGASSNLAFFTNSINQEQLRVSHTASAVNFVQVTGAATNVPVTVSSQGSDGSVVLQLASKGTAAVSLVTNGSKQFDVFGNASAVNFIRATGNTAGGAPSFNSVGTDTDIDLTLNPKAAGRVRFGTHTATVLTPTGFIEIKDSGGTTRRLLVG